MNASKNTPTPVHFFGDHGKFVMVRVGEGESSFLMLRGREISQRFPYHKDILELIERDHFIEDKRLKVVVIDAGRFHRRNNKIVLIDRSVDFPRGTAEREEAIEFLRRELPDHSVEARRGSMEDYPDYEEWC